MSGQSVGKIIMIILRFRDSAFKNKNIDHRVEEICVLCQQKLHPHLFTRDSTMSIARIYQSTLINVRLVEED